MGEGIAGPSLQELGTKALVNVPTSGGCSAVQRGRRSPQLRPLFKKLIMHR